MELIRCNELLHLLLTTEYRQKMVKQKAQWDIVLYAKCPKCGESFDIVEHCEDLFTNGVQPIEHGTKQTTDFEAVCPECDHEFKVDFEY